MIDELAHSSRCQLSSENAQASIENTKKANSVLKENIEQILLTNQRIFRMEGLSAYTNGIN